MKALEFHDLGVDDRLRLSFEGTFDPHVGLERELEPLLQALEAYAGEWMPDVVEGKRQRTYSQAAIATALKEKRGRKSVAIGLHRTKWPALDMTLRLWLPPAPPRLYLWVAVQPLSFFAEAERCREFVELVRAWASHYAVTHATATSLAEDQLVDSSSFGGDEVPAERDESDGIHEACWLNVFGPKWVETVGRERMLSTPAHRVEELRNGSILLVTWPTAADFASDEARKAQARALVHLRPDLDFDTVLRALRERSATLATVAPCFHPDVAPLLSRVVDGVAISERQRKVAEFNAYRPPAPDEWLPANAALPSDVEDPGLVCKHYAHLAEHLVALLHTPVPSVFEATPESLTDLDFHLWRENFPEAFERQHLDERAVPAIGAYLGEVLVRGLGGQWIPRKKLEEAQVRVGNRVWLPFVRAHRSMRSRQALLESSLTQLYREAERHQG